MNNEEKQRRDLEKRIKRFKASQQKSEQLSPWTGLSLLGSLGFVVAVSILAGIGLGIYLDKKLHTDPWFTLIGLLVGLTAAIFGAYELIKSISKDQK